MLSSLSTAVIVRKLSNEWRPWMWHHCDVVLEREYTKRIVFGVGGGDMIVYWERVCTRVCNAFHLYVVCRQVTRSRWYLALTQISWPGYTPWSCEETTSPAPPASTYPTSKICSWWVHVDCGVPQHVHCRPSQCTSTVGHRSTHRLLGVTAHFNCYITHTISFFNTLKNAVESNCFEAFKLLAKTSLTS